MLKMLAFSPLDELQLASTDAHVLDVDLLAKTTFKTKISLFGCLLACHLPFADGWLGILAVVAEAEASAPFGAQVLVACCERVRTERRLAFVVCDLVLSVLLARRAVPVASLGRLHRYFLTRMFFLRRGTFIKLTVAIYSGSTSTALPFSIKMSAMSAGSCSFCSGWNGP